MQLPLPPQQRLRIPRNFPPHGPVPFLIFNPTFPIRFVRRDDEMLRVCGDCTAERGFMIYLLIEMGKGRTGACWGGSCRQGWKGCRSEGQMPRGQMGEGCVVRGQTS